MRSWNYDIKESARHTVKVTAGRSEFASQRVLRWCCRFRFYQVSSLTPHLSLDSMPIDFPLLGHHYVFPRRLISFPATTHDQMSRSSPLQRPPSPHQTYSSLTLEVIPALASESLVGDAYHFKNYFCLTLPMLVGPLLQLLLPWSVALSILSFANSYWAFNLKAVTSS